MGHNGSSKTCRNKKHSHYTSKKVDEGLVKSLCPSGRSQHSFLNLRSRNLWKQLGHGKSESYWNIIHLQEKAVVLHHLDRKKNADMMFTTSSTMTMTSTPAPTSKGCCGLAEMQHNSLPLMWRMTTFSSSMEASPSPQCHTQRHRRHHSKQANFARRMVRLRFMSFSCCWCCCCCRVYK